MIRETHTASRVVARWLLNGTLPVHVLCSRLGRHKGRGLRMFRLTDGRDGLGMAVRAAVVQEGQAEEPYGAPTAMTPPAAPGRFQPDRDEMAIWHIPPNVLFVLILRVTG